jgi:hypothetical protein
MRALHPRGTFRLPGRADSCSCFVRVLRPSPPPSLPQPLGPPRPLGLHWPVRPVRAGAGWAVRGARRAYGGQPGFGAAVDPGVVAPAPGDAPLRRPRRPRRPRRRRPRAAATAARGAAQAPAVIPVPASAARLRLAGAAGAGAGRLPQPVAASAGAAGDGRPAAGRPQAARLLRPLCRMLAVPPSNTNLPPPPAPRTVPAGTMAASTAAATAPAATPAPAPAPSPHQPKPPPLRPPRASAFA